MSADKIKVMIWELEKGLVCEVSLDVSQLEYISSFKYLGFVLD